MMSDKKASAYNIVMMAMRGDDVSGFPELSIDDFLQVNMAAFVLEELEHPAAKPLNELVERKNAIDDSKFEDIPF